MESLDIFSRVTLGKLELANRIVMAPMTRSRADIDAVPTDIMVDYYAQRASAGLIVSEGVAPQCQWPGILSYTRFVQ